jgi:hypothetical protein
MRLLDPVFLLDATDETQGLTHACHIRGRPAGNLTVAGYAQRIESAFED